jgi:pterin-4a-carbinolamine dehydratase
MTTPTTTPRDCPELISPELQSLGNQTQVVARLYLAADPSQPPTHDLTVARRDLAAMQSRYFASLGPRGSLGMQAAQREVAALNETLTRMNSIAKVAEDALDHPAMTERLVMDAECIVSLLRERGHTDRHDPDWILKMLRCEVIALTADRLMDLVERELTGPDAMLDSR